MSMTDQLKEQGIIVKAQRFNTEPKKFDDRNINGVKARRRRIKKKNGNV